MPQFFKKRPVIFVVLVAILLIVLMVVTSAQRERVSPVEGVIGDVVTPVQNVMYGIATYISNFFTGIADRREMEREYHQLQERVAELEKQQIYIEELERENERLSNLLEFSRRNEMLTVTGARVTGKNPSNWFNIFTIDKGTNHGVAINMAVVTNNGLVGRIIDVGPNWSKVRSIVDGQSSVSGIIERTRDVGMVRGSNTFTFEDGMGRMVHLPLDSDLVEGDSVITSGLGEIFPKGIYIGQVKEVVQERRDLFKTAIIEPGVDFRRLEEVLVVTSGYND